MSRRILTGLSGTAVGHRFTQGALRSCSPPLASACSPLGFVSPWGVTHLGSWGLGELRPAVILVNETDVTTLEEPQELGWMLPAHGKLY